MGLIFLILYIFVSLIFPAEIFPALAAYHFPFWIAIGGLSASIVLILLRRGEPLRSLPVYILLSFFVVLILSWMIADRWWGAPSAAIMEFAPSLTMFVLAICTVDSLRKMNLVTGSVVLFSLVVMAQGFAAYHFGINKKMFLFDETIRNEQSLEERASDEDSVDGPYEAAEEEVPSGVRIRGLGILHDPNDLALSFVAVLPFVGVGLRRRGALTSLVEFLLSAALCYGVYMTHSRGGALGLLCVLFFILSRRMGRLPAALLVGVLALGGAAANIGGERRFSVEEESAAGRIEAWTEGLDMLKSQPLMGVGYRQFSEHHTLTAHNSFVLCFAETGLIGYFLWLSLLGITLLQLQKLKQFENDDPVARDIGRHASILQSAIIGFMAAAFFLSRTYDPLLYLLIGLSAALVLIAKKNDVTVELPAFPWMGASIAVLEFASILLIYVITKLQFIT